MCIPRGISSNVSTNIRKKYSEFLEIRSVCAMFRVALYMRLCGPKVCTFAWEAQFADYTSCSCRLLGYRYMIHQNVWSVAVDIYIQSATQKFRWDGNYAPYDNKKFPILTIMHNVRTSQPIHHNVSCIWTLSGGGDEGRGYSCQR